MRKIEANERKVENEDIKETGMEEYLMSIAEIISEGDIREL